MDTCFLKFFFIFIYFLLTECVFYSIDVCRLPRSFNHSLVLLLLLLFFTLCYACCIQIIYSWSPNSYATKKGRSILVSTKPTCTCLKRKKKKTKHQNLLLFRQFKKEKKSIHLNKRNRKKYYLLIVLMANLYFQVFIFFFCFFFLYT